MRERVHVRCVCGYERTVWLQDMQTGRSTGCDSRLCAARYLAVDDVRQTLAGWSLEQSRALADASARHAVDGPVMRELAAELERARQAGIDRVVDAFLRGPREPPDAMAVYR